ncbi:MULTISPECIES: hypothetical protein [Methylobacterium]|uniref:hypothetical protein n=1 Tax=Methylobacterium TaxID=407 RepID=UPI0013EAEB57|nr:hypothetical protein [Methylobacterium sp. DB0501]NGM34139.1 hypothetical protein [Methylobacterium sp. DB0501]
MLCEVEVLPLTSPKQRSATAVRAAADRDFQHWLSKATQRFELAQEAVDREYGKDATFDPHRTTEQSPGAPAAVATV